MVTDALACRYHIGRHVNNLQVANTYVSLPMYFMRRMLTICLPGGNLCTYMAIALRILADLLQDIHTLILGKAITGIQAFT